MGCDRVIKPIAQQKQLHHRHVHNFVSPEPNSVLCAHHTVLAVHGLCSTSTIAASESA